MIKDTFINTLS